MGAAVGKENWQTTRAVKCKTNYGSLSKQ